MTSVPKTLRDADLRDRTLEVLQYLKPALYHLDGPQITTADVDGEFYWRAARGDVTECVLAIRHHFGIEKDANLLEEHQSAFDAALERMSNQFAIPLPAVRRHVLHDQRLFVREPVVTISLGMNPDMVDTDQDSKYPVLERLSVRIPSAQMTGKDVIDLLGRVIPDLESPFFGPVPKTDPHGRNQVCIDFFPPDHVEPNADVVEMHVAMPLPPLTTIGQAYDATVRDQHAWHLSLRDGGVEGQQTPEVSARTWALGLLVSAGLRFPAAQHELKSMTGLDGVNQNMFNVDRLKLLCRVPEARPFLYHNKVRKRRSPSNKKT